jgi:hypothetical protein
MATSETTALEFGWSQIAASLLRSRGIESGLWQLSVGLRFAGLNSGPDDDAMMPTGLVAFERIVLTKVTARGPLVFDAATFVQAGTAAATGKAAGKSTAKSSAKAAGTSTTVSLGEQLRKKLSQP